MCYWCVIGFQQAYDQGMHAYLTWASDTPASPAIPVPRAVAVLPVDTGVTTPMQTTVAKVWARLKKHKELVFDADSEITVGWRYHPFPKKLGEAIIRSIQDLETWVSSFDASVTCEFFPPSFFLFCFGFGS